MLEELRQSLKLMNNADTLGSIMKFYLSDATRNTVMVRVQEYEEQLALGEIVTEENHLLLPYMHIILALTDKYAAICMNPPYMGSGRFDATLSKYVKDNYPKSKADLFAVFMDVAIDRLADCGKYGMINMHSWMFLSSFEELRKSLLDNEHIDSLLHLGPRTFDELSGEVVQNAAFVISKVDLTHDTGTYFRLVDGSNCGEKEQMFFDAQTNHTEKLYYANVEQGNFEKIPGSPFGYWVNKHALKAFDNENVASIANTRKGMATGLNAVFVRSWFETCFDKIGFNLSREEAKESLYKWFPYANGGSYRKWYGNLEEVVLWQNDGYRLQTELTDDGSRVRAVNLNLDYIFKKGIFWTSITSGNNSMKLLPKGCLFSSASNACFPSDVSRVNYILALLNSEVSRFYAKIINPSLNANPGDIGKIPTIKKAGMSLDTIVNQNINISKEDWDSHETSWDFETNPLVAQCNQFRNDGCTATSYRIENFVKEFEEQWEARFYQLKDNEEELNRQFIEIYGLQDELEPFVPTREITILQQGEISIVPAPGDDSGYGDTIRWNRDVLMKQLISYAVGCMMGRYSIDKPGLILANQGDGLEQYNKQVPDSRFEPDDDGIIPLMSAQSDFADNATIRFKQWLVAAFGEDSLVENLNFIEKCLGKSIDDYFVKDFWKDHKKMYQNRPIYWLFSSKKGAFQCLACMHRMDAYTAERIRTKYLLPHIEWLVQKQSEMEAIAANLNARERKELDSIGKQIDECREYHDRLHVIADEQIAFDLDDGVVVNYAKFGDTLAKIK